MSCFSRAAAFMRKVQTLPDHSTEGRRPGKKSSSLSSSHSLISRWCLPLAQSNEKAKVK